MIYRRQVKVVQIQGEKKQCEIFSISLSIHGFNELKSCIHASSSGHRSVCIYDKKISMTAQEQEHKFRGSISLTINDFIIDIISAYVSVLKDDDI